MKVRAILEITLLVVIPAVLAFIEIFHPAHLQGHIFNTLYPMTSRWLFIHYVQSFLFALITFATFYLTREDKGPLIVLIRIFLFLFLVTYTVMDAVAGIAVGRILEYEVTAQLAPSCVRQVAQLLFLDNVVGGLGSIYSLAGSVTWLLAMLLTVVQLIRKGWALGCKNCWPAYLLYTVSAIALYISHARPYGPIAFFSFALASAWLLMLKHRAKSADTPTLL